jgi:hypothetical protein
VSGKKWALGLCALVVVALGCGNTGQNPDGDGTSGMSGGGAAAGGTASNVGAESGEGGSEEGGASAGGAPDASGGTAPSAGQPAADGGEAGVVPPKPRDRAQIVRDRVPNKLDLLMMIDNSISMGDKQHLLADAMEHLVNRLVQPYCLDERGERTGARSSADGACPLGSHPEFLPFRDIHAAVVTSSLGSHGALGARDICTQAADDDHAQLLGVLRPGLSSWNQRGFLAWDPEQKLSPVGIAEPSAFAQALGAHVQAAGDHGCGYEGSLEAWYRFLVDPEPPAGVSRDPDGATSYVTGTSAEILAQRAEFLRPDSVLGIVMLSDENDCSIVDSGYGWLVARSPSPGTAPNMYRSTSQCLTNPNDPCCQSCGESVARPGCPALTTDVECMKGSSLTSAEDSPNLRCYAQKQRFGFDLLYPVQRYVDAVTKTQVPRRSDGALVSNPIYQSREGVAPRSPEQVLLLGIVGVPWQDLADPASLTGPGLRFLSEEAQLPEERWSIILGEPSASPPILPLDPFMVETTVDRTTLPIAQSNPIVPSEKLAPATSTNPFDNRINGHEKVDVNQSDLQLACTFPLWTPQVCDQAASDAGKACDCFDGDLAYNSPLCQPPLGGPAATTQYFGKAYPGLRELQVLRGVGGHGIVASTCPKSADVQSASYGYRPAMDALAGRVARQIGRSCLGLDARADADGRIDCQVITASSRASCACPAGQGLAPASAAARTEVLAELASVGYCGPGMSCDALCVCALDQLTGSDLKECQTSAVVPQVPGFCYLNAVEGEVKVGSPELARDCVGGAPRRIRFSGGAPAESSIALLYCPG